MSRSKEQMKYCVDDRVFSKGGFYYKMIINLAGCLPENFLDGRLETCKILIATVDMVSNFCFYPGF